MMRVRVSLWWTLAFVAAPCLATAQEPTLETVLERAGAYVTEFQRQLSGVVAEESYSQDVNGQSSGNNLRQAPRSDHRDLKSDLLLVKPPGAARWIQFRDVFSVDGMPVRDRNERLVKLFLEPSASTASQVERIVVDSARYNIGNVLRTINVPVFALLALEPHRQNSFRFTRAKAGATAIGRDLTAPEDAWVIKYDEQGPGTMITTTNGRDLPSHGRFWIDPLTGRVIMTELIAEDFAIRGTIVVRYQPDASTGLLLPAAMRERYDVRQNGTRVNGSATYGKFRQFQVKVDEKIAPIKQ